MINETKRDVLVDAVDALADAQASSDNNVGLGHQDADLFMAEYDAALPDNLPVIPRAVSDVLAELKRNKLALYASMAYVKVVSLSSWMTFEHEEDFARAWLLGVWRVEETGEVVKL